MSKTVSNIICSMADIVTLPLSPRQKAKTLARAAANIGSKGDTLIETPHGPIKFLAGRGASIASAVNRFFEDEPETLYYIDNIIQPGEVLWDIGANVGLYSLYAAKRGATVYAFEPSAFNFGLLVEHIHLNNLSKNIKPLCLALSDHDGMTELNMCNVDIGHASNALGEAVNQSGHFITEFQQTVLFYSIDNFAAKFGGTPDHIKLDVDGLEPLIVKGASEVLKKCKSLLIEVEGENEKEDARLVEMITAAGLHEDESFRKRSAHARNRLYLRSEQPV